jgi:hypothetical protein
MTSTFHRHRILQEHLDVVLPSSRREIALFYCREGHAFVDFALFFFFR